MLPEAKSSPLLPKLGRYTLSSLATVGAVGLLEVLRARFQQSHMFEPSRYPEGEWDPGRHGLPYEDVWFDSDKGIRLHGWWIPRSDARATVLYCHGNAGSLGDRIEVFTNLRRLQVNIFAFDYRGFGRSTDEAPSEKGLFLDARAAYSQLVEEIGVNPEKVILFGHSLGGAVAVDAALDCPVAGLVVQSSLTDLRDMARHIYPRLPMHLITRNGFRSISKVERLPMPKLFLHGTADLTVPFFMGERLFAQAAGPKAWFPVAEAGHSDLHVHGRLPYFRMLARFRRRCVG